MSPRQPAETGRDAPDGAAEDDGKVVRMSGQPAPSPGDDPEDEPSARPGKGGGKNRKGKGRGRAGRGAKADPGPGDDEAVLEDESQDDEDATDDKIPLPPVRPVAPPAAPRARHALLVVSFLLMVLLPVTATAWYLWERAADQYASYLGFSVRTEEVGSAIEILGGITELSGSSSSDVDILYEFLQSQELVRAIDADLDLREMWSRPGYENDPIFAYDPPGTIEDLVAQWKRMVRISYSVSSGLLNVRVLAFEPEDATRVAEAIFAASTDMVNEISAIAREDAIKYAREELDTSVQRLREARAAVTEFRNRTQIVDPTMDTQGQMGIVNNLQAQLAEAMVDLDLLRGTTREGDPRLSQAVRRIEVIEQRIAEEREKLGFVGEAGDSAAIADIVGEYEVLVVDREFAEQSYTAALAAYDAALAEARRQSRYIAAHVHPTRAERSEFPQRGTLLGLVALFALMIWSISVLIAYSLRDRN